MIQIISLSDRGQITIPAAVRKRLGLISGEKALLRLTPDSLIVKPVQELRDVMKLYGSIDPKGKSTDIDFAIISAKKLKATRTVKGESR